jgi:hypothetical protein
MRKPRVSFSQPLFDEICAQLAEGKMLSEICQGNEMPERSAVVKWANENHEGCYQQYARARDIGYQLIAEDILLIADTPVSTERGDQVDRSRLRVDSRKWLLSKALPKIYGDKQTVEGKFTVDWAQVAQEAADKYAAKHKKPEG